MSESGNPLNDLIIGIDLGTTNSEVAAFVDSKVTILSSGTKNMVPSVVGLSSAGDLLVGEAARNQLMLYPERSVRSIKRKMGSNETVSLGDCQFTPQEISALILRELASWASRQPGIWRRRSSYSHGLRSWRWHIRCVHLCARG
jgi:molecular chaperone DnaK (HSP70)